MHSLKHNTFLASISCQQQGVLSVTAWLFPLDVAPVEDAVIPVEQVAAEDELLLLDSVTNQIMYQKLLLEWQLQLQWHLWHRCLWWLEQPWHCL